MGDGGPTSDRMFSIDGTMGRSLILLKKGELYLVVDDLARPLTGGDIDIHPEDIRRYAYMQDVPGMGQDEAGHRNVRWELDEVPMADFDVTPRSDSWPGYRVHRRELSSH